MRRSKRPVTPIYNVDFSGQHPRLPYVRFSMSLEARDSFRVDFTDATTPNELTPMGTTLVNAGIFRLLQLPLDERISLYADDARPNSFGLRPAGRQIWMRLRERSNSYMGRPVTVNLNRPATDMLSQTFGNRHYVGFDFDRHDGYPALRIGTTRRLFQKCADGGYVSGSSITLSEAEADAYGFVLGWRYEMKKVGDDFYVADPVGDMNDPDDPLGGTGRFARPILTVTAWYPGLQDQS